jgi:hypothetical protein
LKDVVYGLPVVGKVTIVPKVHRSRLRDFDVVFSFKTQAAATPTPAANALPTKYKKKEKTPRMSKIDRGSIA